MVRVHVFPTWRRPVGSSQVVARTLALAVPAPARGGLLASFRLAHRRGKGGRIGTFSKNRHFGFGRISEVAPMPLTKRPWTEEDIAKLKQMAQKKPPSEIAAALGRSIGATCVKAHQLKVSLRMPRRWVRRQLPSNGERAPMD